MLGDILFKTDEHVFSYRVAGILINDNKILLQKSANDSGYAIPGGHVSFGELGAETLVREFSLSSQHFRIVAAISRRDSAFYL